MSRIVPRKCDGLWVDSTYILHTRHHFDLVILIVYTKIHKIYNGKNYKVSFRITKTWQYLKYLVFLRNISSSISLLFWNNAICLFFASEWFEIFAQCDSSYISSMSLIFERGRSKYNTVGNGMSKIDLTRRYASNIYVSVKNSLKKA